MKDTLKHIHKVQMELLLEFDEFCKKEGLKYQLFAGTLLGAVRHNGFIPWDDDIDIVMKRDDYEKFLDLYKPNDNVFLQTLSSDPQYYRQFSRLRRNGTIYKQNRYAHLDMHHGVFIDIFPLDYVTNNYSDEKFRMKVINVLTNFNLYRSYLGHWDTYKGERPFKMKLVSLTNYLFSKNLFDKWNKNILMKRKNTGYINHLTDGTTKRMFDRFLMEENDFDEMRYMEFEGYQFPIPKNYHKILTTCYGDYMKLPPIELRHPHHGIVEIKVDDYHQELEYKMMERAE